VRHFGQDQNARLMQLTRTYCWLTWMFNAVYLRRTSTYYLGLFLRT